MEIISEVTSASTIALTIFCIGIVIGVIGYIFLDDTDIVGAIMLGVGMVIVVVGILLVVIADSADKQYRLRVDNQTTVTELKETYDIVRYDPDTDLWIVKKKEVKE